MGECERCKRKIAAGSYDLHDYCAVCEKNLCESCMGEGCCGDVPAQSGMRQDNDNDG